MDFNNNEFTLLSFGQAFETFKKMDASCAVSDFAILLGSDISNDYYVDVYDNFRKARTNWWYLSSSNDYFVQGIVSDRVPDGERIIRGCGSHSSTRCGGVRPVLPYSNISDILTNEVRESEELLEVEYGEYSQYVVDTSLAITLESNYLAGRIKKTGKTYTTDSRKWDDNSAPFRAQEHEEY